MIGKASSVKGSIAGMDYLRAEGKGYELDRNKLLGETSREIMQDFRMQQLGNTTCKRAMFTAVISPDRADGKNLTDLELKKIGKEFMQGLGVDTNKQAYIMIVHTEKLHKHLHLYINRIQDNGKAINDSFIGKKASQVAHNIAKSRGLVSAKDLLNEKVNLAKETDKVLKHEILNKHQAVMHTTPKTFGNYIKEMAKAGLEIQPTINKQGQIQGFRVLDKHSGINHKMSDVNRSLSVNNLIKTGLKNDLGIPFTAALNTVENKQKISANNIKTPSLRSLKSALKEVKPNLKNFNISQKKEIKTKEDYLQALKENKFFEEVVKPASIINMEFIETTRQAEILKDYESKKELEKIEDIEKSEKESKQNQNNLEL